MSQYYLAEEHPSVETLAGKDLGGLRIHDELSNRLRMVG